MKAEISIPFELVETIAQRLAELLKPLVAVPREADCHSDIFDVTGLCKYLLVSKQWVYERTHLNEIPHIKKDGLLRFRRTEIDAWLNESSVPSSGSVRKPLKAVS